jgi:hypothetical protein
MTSKRQSKLEVMSYFWKYAVDAYTQLIMLKLARLLKNSHNQRTNELLIEQKTK